MLLNVGIIVCLLFLLVFTKGYKLCSLILEFSNSYTNAPECMHVFTFLLSCNCKTELLPQIILISYKRNCGE